MIRNEDFFLSQWHNFVINCFTVMNSEVHEQPYKIIISFLDKYALKSRWQLIRLNAITLELSPV